MCDDVKAIDIELVIPPVLGIAYKISLYGLLLSVCGLVGHKQGQPRSHHFELSI